jgi:uncharacterized protein YndB with AHSA1/START domain
MLGTLETTEDGRFALCFERTYPNPQARVWQAIARPDQLRQWFDQMIDYDNSQLDFTEGANLLFVAKDAHLFPALHGRVIQVDPPRLLEYTRASQTLQWRLGATVNGGCRLVFTVFVELRSIAIAGAASWHAELHTLHTTLTGERSMPLDLGSLQQEYERELG